MSKYGWTIATVVAVGILATQSPGEAMWTFGLGVGASYFSFNPNLPAGLVEHETHPDDQVFLTGSAGETDLDPVKVTLLNVHATVARDKGPGGSVQWVGDLVLHLPLSEEGREEVQNANDHRPPEEGAYIYTEVEDIDPAVEIGFGASYHGHFSERVEYTLRPMVYLGYWSMTFDSGWTRFNEDQTAIQSGAKGPSVSPQLHLSAGLKTLQAGLTLGYRYMHLGYDAADLGSEGAHGWDIGAVVTKDF